MGPPSIPYTTYVHRSTSRLPPGVFQIVNGGRAAAEALCDAEKVKAVTFVGSSGVAKAVAARCHAANKRVLALGGAENHLVALPDCE